MPDRLLAEDPDAALRLVGDDFLDPLEDPSARALHDRIEVAAVMQQEPGQARRPAALLRVSGERRQVGLRQRCRGGADIDDLDEVGFVLLAGDDGDGPGPSIA